MTPPDNPPAFPWRETPETRGESEAVAELLLAQRAAEARAARLIAERECPEDIREFGRIHNIPNFAETVWMNGFAAGMRVFMLTERTKPNG